MGKSKVYFTDLQVHNEESLLSKLERLMKAAGFEQLDLDNKYVAIKLHFGEPGNLAFLRSNYAKVVADMVKRAGGKPFLTDCNTLYVGGRKNALDHLDSAYLNGYSPLSTGCHVLIADGLKGTDEALVPVPGGKYVTEAKIGRAVMDADVVISLNHFKGHEATGFGGAIKNLGMGCGSRAGKMEMHNAGKPLVEQSLCVGCGMCQKQCAHDAIAIVSKKASIDHNKCVGCGRCIGACPTDAVGSPCDESNDILCFKMAEYTLAVLHGRPHFHISIATDISPYCDCHGCNHPAIVPNIGMFASFDPVAIDVASADAVNRQSPALDSCLDAANKQFEDHFCNVHPTTNWRKQVEYGEQLGLGSVDYELVTMK